ncbi:sulfurtransferase-like selenium metabolism protein YedF [Lachnospiraceae bacterium ZAX-1]
MITVNAIGDACPIPVVKTKNAIKEMKENGDIEIFVDNEIAVQNLSKMAGQKKYPVSSTKLEEGKFRILMTVDVSREALSNGQAEEATAQEVDCIPAADELRFKGKHTIVAVSSDKMGHGNDELGTVLRKGFFYALTQQEILPETILCYNGGAKLTCEESDSLEDLRSLEAQGVEILTCGTCLNYYELTEKLKVGGITNMYDIVEKMLYADTVLKP